MEDPVEQSNKIVSQKKLWIAQSIAILLAKILLGIGNGLPSKFCNDNPSDEKCVYWTKVNNFVKSKSKVGAPVSQDKIAEEILQTGGAAAKKAAPAADGDASGKLMADIVKAIGKTGWQVTTQSTIAVANILKNGILGQYSDTDWSEIGDEQFRESLNQTIEKLQIQVDNPETMEIIQKWAEAITKYGATYLEIMEPSINLLFDQFWKLLSQMLDKSAIGLANTGMNLAEAAIGEIPVFGGLVDLFIAFMRGLSAGMKAAAPAVEGASTVAGMGVGSTGLVGDGSVSGIWKKVGSLGSNVGEKIAKALPGKKEYDKMMASFTSMAPPSFMTTSPDKPEIPPTDWKGVKEEKGELQDQKKPETSTGVSKDPTGVSKDPTEVSKDPDEVSIGGAPSSNYQSLPNAEKLSLWKDEFMTHTPQGEEWDPGTSNTKKMKEWFNFYLTDLQGKSLKNLFTGTEKAIETSEKEYPLLSTDNMPINEYISTYKPPSFIKSTDSNDPMNKKEWGADKSTYQKDLTWKKWKELLDDSKEEALAEDAEGPYSMGRWYTLGGKPKSVVEKIKIWMGYFKEKQNKAEKKKMQKQKKTRRKAKRDKYSGKRKPRMGMGKMPNMSRSSMLRRGPSWNKHTRPIWGGSNKKNIKNTTKRIQKSIQRFTRRYKPKRRNSIRRR